MRFIFSLLLTLLLTSNAFAQMPPPPALAGTSWLLLDNGTGQILVGHNEDSRIEPASLTKLMTAYVTFSALKAKSISLEQNVPVSERAKSMTGSRMFIEPRRPVTVDQLIHGMIIQSGNDACVALSELIAGSEEAFANLMNTEAKRLGMKNTHFANASGLPDENHYTTARDLSLLAAAIIRDFPEYYPLYSQKEYTYNNIPQPNRNRLLWMDSTVDGMKTGYTKAAGYCLISSAVRGPRRLISVVLGTESESIRAQESLKLLNYGFQFYDTVRLYTAGQALSNFQIWKGQVSEVPVGFLNDFTMSIPKNQRDKITATLASQQPLLAPVQKGQEVGRLTLKADNQIIGEYPIFALEDVEIAGFFGRTWDAVHLWIKGL